MKLLAKTILILSVFTLTAGMSSFKSGSEDFNNNVSEDKLYKHDGETVKPHAPIDLKFTAGRFQVGVEAEIPLTIISSTKADDLTIRYFVKEEGIHLYNAQIDVSFGPQQQKQNNTHTLTLMPNADGEYLIYLTATITKNAKQQGRSFVIPVRVGNAQKQKVHQPAGLIMEDPGGTPIISMPAVESTD